MANKSLKLKQKQWLNIIIIVTSAMFLLMVLVGKMLERANDAGAVEGVAQEFYKLDFGDVSIRNNDGVWSSTAKELSQPAIERLIQNWKKLLQRDGLLLEQSEDTGKTVLIYLTNSMSPIICKLVQREGQLDFQFVQSGQKIVVENARVSDYIPITQVNN